MLLLIMIFNDVDFGVEVRRKYFYFEEGFMFINYGLFGVVFILIREKRK